jgi:hypothetical protein
MLGMQVDGLAIRISSIMQDEEVTSCHTAVKKPYQSHGVTTV